MRKLLRFSLIVFLFSCADLSAQDVSLYDQFNGRFDFVFIGNTMNVAENTANDPCIILTSSSAELSLGTGDEVEKAYLYWAGSGTGDFDVRLNDVDITAQRNFPLVSFVTGLPFFSAFADVTAQVQATGNGTYMLSGLDVSPWLNAIDYCSNGTNFAGWAIVIVYKNAALPLNQLNLYDGLQSVPTSSSNVPSSINITLSSINVIDDVGAKIGFVAWEGDASIPVSETLSINGTPLSNPPLNPVNNAFNSTNSFTGATNLYNMDLDVYPIQDNIAIGDTSAQITLTSGQDFVMINVVMTKLNSQLPDATIQTSDYISQCNSRDVTYDFTVFNVNSTNELAAGTPIAAYVGGVLVGTAQTTAVIPIGGSESGQMTVTIPESSLDTFDILFVVDDNGTGAGIVTELNENNNTFATNGSLLPLPEFNVPPDLVSCNLGLTAGNFDFSDYPDLIRIDGLQVVSFYESQSDAETGSSEILNTSDYHAASTPHQIFFRIFDGTCYNTGSFFLRVRNCPPTIYNYISANEDGVNDSFHIDGLRDIFLNYQLRVYNRWGVLVWTGNNNTEEWRGFATKGFRPMGNELPDGTYYYVLDLNDPDYPNSYTGFLYLTRG